jgi:5-methylcytosine-specific restriction protein A
MALRAQKLKIDLGKMENIFKVGQIYNRKNEIHEIYSGQSQGGISSPANHPIIFVFTGETGEKYGYRDGFRSDGVFLLTGEGMEGDMSFVRGNKAILEHEKNGKALLLFQILKTKGFVQFMGETKVIGYHFEKRPDIKGNIREAIIFELEIIPDVPKIKDELAEPPPIYLASEDFSKLDMKTLLQIIGEKQVGSGSYLESVKRVYERSEAVKHYVLKRANGTCESCQKPAPFLTAKKKTKYLEPHHLTRISDGGPDHPLHVAAICPNCHREVHYGENGESKNEALRASTMTKQLEIEIRDQY